MPKPLQHLMIVANAGSGKTYRLCLRYIELLTHGIPAEQLVALTFTRKAAGEFIDRIFSRLAEAALSPAEAALLTRELESDGQPLSTTHFLNALRSVTDSLHKLNLTTIDSFLFRIVSAFPLECGLASVPEILTDFQAEKFKQQAFESAFSFSELTETERENLIALVRKQQRGYFKRTIVSAWQYLWKTYYPMLDQFPSASWGNLPLNVCTVGKEISEREFLDRAEMLHAQAEKQCDSYAFIFLSEHIEWLINSYRMQRLHEKSAGLIVRLPTIDKKNDTVRIRSRRMLEFPTSIWNELETLLLAAAQQELRSIAEASRAAHALVRRLAAHYDQSTQKSGRLSFSQITALTAKLSQESFGSTGSLLHHLAYRINTRFNHWLLDEFQDTSRQQWEALSQFVDEVLQSDCGNRSLFYVGDTKQAIYTWRGGDPALFFHIRDHYNKHTSLIHEENLTVSYRSSPVITETVNQIFGNLANAALPIPPEVLHTWQQAWRDHEAFHIDRPGYFSCQLLDTPEGSRGKEDLREATLQLLQEITPTQRGWECAILVQSNTEVETYVNLLLTHGIHAAGEGVQSLRNGCQLVEIISSALRLVINPNDRFSLIHVKSSPLAEAAALKVDDPEFETEDGEPALAFRFAALHQLYTRGLPHLIRSWIEQFGSLDAFNQERADWLLALADEHCRATDPLNLIDFVEAINTATRRDTSGSQTIKVMTIHSAKGLTFDMVVLPDLKEYHRSSLGWVEPQTFLSGKTETGFWAIPNPGKELCSLNPHLQEAAEIASAQAFYENLCKYYVAITRPRHAAYLFGRRPSTQSKVTDFVSILQATLLRDRTNYTAGNPNWYETHNLQMSG